MATDPDKPDDAGDETADTSAGGSLQPPAGDPADRPTGEGSEPSGQPPNPFAGTPFEHMLGSMSGLGGASGGGGAGAAGGFGGPGGIDLAALFGQMQQWLAPHDGPVNWELSIQVARQVVAQQPDPSPSIGQQSAVSDAVRLADLWLDSVTDLPSGASVAQAWSRAQWIESTRPVWARVVEPVAEHVTAAVGQAMPEEIKAMAGPLVGLLSQAGSAMFGQQLGQGLGALAGEVLSGTDVGLPLAPAGTAALLPTNIAAFGEGLDQTAADVLLYMALRECAHQRLFVHVPWLAPHLLGSVEAYARGTRIDLSAIEEAVRGLDPTDPQAMQEALAGGMFEPRSTPGQQAALTRLETILALVEGWVDEVVGQATVDRMPSAAPLGEAVRRRRAAGGPAEQTFASLVGLELRPRRLRDAATLWGALRDREGAAARDAVWAHPDLVPSAEDLDDPLGFRPGAAPPGAGSGAGGEGDDMDAALRQLLDDDERGSAGS
ncbi:MAG TPA: zinc-dependent metalloprotease [Nocardioidaceae bacterium]|nr:zinc-dependent metalloprotease [Nocardioidaceae bacterium]